MSKTMILNSIFITYLSLIISYNIPTSKSEPIPITGFTVDLIHRDSPQSPTYDPSLTPSQRLANTFKRSFSRLRRFNSNPSKQSPNSDITISSGEYLLNYSIGTPPLPSLGIADTGSDLTWTQCQPCIQCFKQYLPIFNPKTSPTYKKIPCNSPKCKSLKETSCSKTRQDNCVYNETYGDGSFTKGELGTDTITLGQRVSVPNITLGCGFKNGGIFSGGESGIVGLGGGKASLVTQLGPLAQGKFSYCLVSVTDGKNSSKLSFGSNAEVLGKDVVSTPLVKKKIETFYYLTLEGISVGNRRLEFNDPTSNNLTAHRHEEGNIIIDSGTTALLLPFDLYAKFETELENSIKLKQVDDPLDVFELCYNTREDNIEIPDVIAHFKGADVKLRTENIFVRTSNVSLCFAASPIEGGAIYGSLAQVNFLVGYDLVKGTVSFKPTHCGK